MLIRQLFDKDTCTFTYLLADRAAGEAVLIDPVRERVERDVALLEELAVDLVYALDTHAHADHVTGAAALRERLGCRVVISRAAGAKNADRYVAEGDRVVFGSHALEVRATPGHTDGCVTYVARDGGRTYAFTGDALFIRGCGRTDFQAGNARTLYRSVHDKIYSLPDDTVIYPGHDYRGHTATTVAEEKANNPRLRLSISQDEFVDIMSQLDLPNPKRMAVAVPANLVCGHVA